MLEIKVESMQACCRLPLQHVVLYDGHFLMSQMALTDVSRVASKLGVATGNTTLCTGFGGPADGFD